MHIVFYDEIGHMVDGSVIILMWDGELGIDVSLKLGIHFFDK